MCLFTMCFKSKMLLFAMASIVRAFEYLYADEGGGDGQAVQYGDEGPMMPYDYELMRNEDELTLSDNESEDLLRQGEMDINNRTMFSALENYQIGATPASEKEFEFMARVVHSRSMDYPHICTAICVSIRIFATAARCIRSLKVDFTTVIYTMKQFPAIAFVMPEKPSKQMFDDIGFIIVSSDVPLGQWKTIKLFTGSPRTDEYFQWFRRYSNDNRTKVDGSNYYVVGYAMDKNDFQILNPKTEFLLHKIPNVLVGIDMCSVIFTKNMAKGYFVTGKDFIVPCFLSCPRKAFHAILNEYTNHKKTSADTWKKCPYLGVEGAAVVMKSPYCLLGIAIWGPQYSGVGLPVGFSVPNSDTFNNDYECAKKIRDDTSANGARGGTMGLPPPKLEC